MVNSYVMHVRYCEAKGLRPNYSHHDFVEKIGRAHLDPDNHWPRRKSPPEGEAEVMAVATPLKPAPMMTGKALSPYRGKLKVRLNHSYTHFPVECPGGGRNVCQLHRWAYRESLVGKDVEDMKKKSLPAGSRKNVMYCETCATKLCISCWKMYHTVERFRKSEVQRILDN